MLLTVALSLLGLTMLPVVIAQIVGTRLSAPPYEGPVTEHFDGTVFRNREPVKLPDFRMGLRYFFSSDPGPWDEWREIERQAPPPERVGSGELRVHFVNHATTLVQMDGMNILTDPIWAERASPFTFMGPKRRHAPGISLDDLPPIDLVLVSHNHYDHMNVPTLQSLAERHDPLFVVGLGNGRYLKKQGLHNVKELDWNESLKHGSLEVIGQRARHFSSRGFADRQKNLWMSFVIEGEAGKVYFAGDTSYGSHFAETGANHGPFRLAILPIGAYEPRWFMGPVHINPTEAVQAHRDLRAATSLAMHFGTFRLTQEGQDAPVADLKTALTEQRVTEDRFWVLPPGAGADVPALD